MQNWRKIIRITSVTLCCLTIWSGCMVGRLLARYTTSDTSGDQARVAGFHINIKADNNENTLPLGIGLGHETGDDTKQQVVFTVSGSTEVQLEYGLLVELTHADGTSLTREQWDKIQPKIEPLPGIAGKEVIGTANATESAASCVYTFSGTKNVAPIDNYNQNYRLTFDSTDTGSYTDGFQVKIYIDGQQVD